MITISTRLALFYKAFLGRPRDTRHREGYHCTTPVRMLTQSSHAYVGTVVIRTGVHQGVGEGQSHGELWCTR